MNLTKKQTEEALSNFLEEKDGLNDVLQMMLNSMMLCERKEYLSETPDNKGNGYRQSNVFGYGHQIELRIPRDRQSAFMPTILALFREQESYLKEVSFQMYSKGLTTRDISEVMETIYGTHYSKSKISNITQGFYEQMEAWRNRDLDKHYLAFFIDGLFVKLKRDSKYKNECFYIVLGLKEDYTREIVAIVNFPTESSEGWRHLFEDLKTRGLETVGLVVSDGITGIDSAIAEKFKDTPHQRCIVHLQRNLSVFVRKEDKKELAEDIRQILNPDEKDYTKEEALNSLVDFGEKWKSKYKAFGKHLEKMNWEPFFTYLNFSVKIRRMIYTTNWIERFNRSCRRTLKIRGAFPSEESVLALLTSVAIDKSNKTYKYPIYNFKFETKLSNKSIKD